MDNEKLKALSDAELLHRLSEILKQSRRVESILIAHIAEVDARGVYAREASPSMFAYCTDVLSLSEGEAYLRIGAARASRRYPVLLSMLEDGRLHLTAIAKLSPHLTDDNVDDLLARSTHRSKRQILELIAELAPKPDVPSLIRKLPTRDAPQNQLRPDAIGDSQESSAVAQSSPRPPVRTELAPQAVVEPLAPARYKVQFTASAEFRQKLDRLAALMPGLDLASMLDAAVTEKLERLKATRFGKTKHPRKSVDEADTSPGVRGIAAPVKRFVWERDGGQCTFVAGDGRRCPERHRLEFHHDEPYGVGGDRSVENIRLLCRLHNRYMAELDYGRDKILVPTARPDAVHLATIRLPSGAFTGAAR